MGSNLKTATAYLGIFLVFWLGIHYLLPLTLPFLLGTVLALLAEPMVGFFCKRFHMPRSVSAGVGVSMTFFCLGLLVLMAAAFLVRELGMLAGVLPDLEDAAMSGISSLQGWLLELAEHTPPAIRPLLSQNVTDFFSDGTSLLNRGVSYVLSLAGSLLSHIPDSALGLGTTVISGFMISAKLPKIKERIAARLPREKLRPLLRTVKRVRAAVGGWLKAQVKLMGTTFLILTAGLLILRIPYALIWALGISFVDALPVLGTGTVLLPWAVICLLQADTPRAVGLAGIYVVISVTRSVLEPKLVGKQLGLDPLVTLIALYMGYKLWGIGGMIFAPLLTVTAMQMMPKKETE